MIDEFPIKTHFHFMFSLTRPCKKKMLVEIVYLTDCISHRHIILLILVLIERYTSASFSQHIIIT